MKAIALPIEVKVKVVVVIAVEVVFGGAEGVAVIVVGGIGGEVGCGGEGGKYEEDYEEGDGEFHGFGVCCFLFCSESILAERKGLCLGLMGKNSDRKGCFEKEALAIIFCEQIFNVINNIKNKFVLKRYLFL